MHDRAYNSKYNFRYNLKIPFRKLDQTKMYSPSHMTVIRCKSLYNLCTWHSSSYKRAVRCNSQFRQPEQLHSYCYIEESEGYILQKALQQWRWTTKRCVTPQSPWISTCLSNFPNCLRTPSFDHPKGGVARAFLGLKPGVHAWFWVGSRVWRNKATSFPENRKFVTTCAWVRTQALCNVSYCTVNHYPHKRYHACAVCWFFLGIFRRSRNSEKTGDLTVQKKFVC